MGSSGLGAKHREHLQNEKDKNTQCYFRIATLSTKITLFLGDRLLNSSPYAIGPLSVLSVCDVGVLWPNGWMDYDATWYRGRPWTRPHCIRWGPSCPKRGIAPNFRPMSVVAKRLDG